MPGESQPPRPPAGTIKRLPGVWTNADDADGAETDADGTDADAADGTDADDADWPASVLTTDAAEAADTSARFVAKTTAD
jgi:hypothetical protein